MGADDYVIDGDLSFSSTSSALKFYREQYHKKKEWVGLTDDEIEKIFKTCTMFNTPVYFASQIEAKLKDKNT